MSIVFESPVFVVVVFDVVVHVESLAHSVLHSVLHEVSHDFGHGTSSLVSQKYNLHVFEQKYIHFPVHGH